MSDGKINDSVHDTKLWVSADARRLPLRIESAVFIGSVRIDLVKVIDNAAGDGLSNADKVALGDYARGFGAIPAAVRAHLHDLLDKAQDKYDASSAHGEKEGVFLPAPDKVKD